jgi:hypothetical protein
LVSSFEVRFWKSFITLKLTHMRRGGMFFPLLELNLRKLKANEIFLNCFLQRQCM